MTAGVCVCVAAPRCRTLSTGRGAALHRRSAPGMRDERALNAAR